MFNSSSCKTPNPRRLLPDLSPETWRGKGAIELMCQVMDMNVLQLEGNWHSHGQESVFDITRQVNG